MLFAAETARPGRQSVADAYGPAVCAMDYDPLDAAPVHFTM